MIIEDAYQILKISPNSTEAEQLSAYEETRTKLENKLAKAPTPGLKEKYRASLRQIEEAFELLSSNADAGDLPVTNRPPIEHSPSPQYSSEPSNNKAPTSSSPSTRSYSNEITTIAAGLIIVVLAGIWFMTRTSDEEFVLANIESLQTEIEDTRQSYSSLMNMTYDNPELRLRTAFLELVTSGYVIEYEDHLDNALAYREAQEWSDARKEMKLASENHELFKLDLADEWRLVENQR